MTTVTHHVHYPAPLGTRVKCCRQARRSPVWSRFDGRTGRVNANSNGEIAVELDGSSGSVFWFRPDELVRSTGE
jgi:hypothetical protein